MEKQIRDFKVDIYLDWTYSISIERLREDLGELEALGVTEIRIHSYDDYGSTGISIEAFARRLETDEEFAKRVEMEESIKEVQRKRDLAELKRLKEIYNG